MKHKKQPLPAEEAKTAKGKPPEKFTKQPAGKTAENQNIKTKQAPRSK